MKLFQMIAVILIYSLIGLSVSIEKGPNRQAILMTVNSWEVNSVIRRPQTYYTQGIFFSDDGKSLYESGGLYGQSVLVKMDYPSLNVVQKVPLDGKYFAEGIAKCGDYIYQLTWRERKILKYRLDNLSLVGTLELDTNVREGWGLATFSNNRLIASDGSDNIYFLDCDKNLAVVDKIKVTNNNQPIDRLNALEFSNGTIYANRYFDTRIFKINPKNGNVETVYQLDGLVEMEYSKNTLTPERLNSGDVLNGIAYDKNLGIFILTGKKWGHYYQVSLK